VPVLDIKAEIVAQALIFAWFGVFGPQDSIIFDQEHDKKEFGNELLQAIYDLMGVIKMSTVGYRPHGITERFNCTMTSFITKVVQGVHTQWEAVLPALMLQYNTMAYFMTGFLPALLSLGREIPSSLVKEFIIPKSFNAGKWVESGVFTLIKYVADVAKLKKEQQEKQAQKFNDKKHERFPTFVNSGMKILIQQEDQTNLNKQEHEKLIPLYNGPYEVVRYTLRMLYLLFMLEKTRKWSELKGSSCIVKGH
jgi:hypothetical protein